MAKYDLSKPMRIAQFEKRIKALMAKNCFVELREITIRSLSQNNYLHLILSFYGLEFGYSLNYVKRNIFKALINPTMFIVEKVNEKNGEVYKDLLSTSEISKTDMIIAIDRFKNHSAQGGLVLPDPSNLIYLRDIAEEIDMAKRYL
jgi:hypothetical protein